MTLRKVKVESNFGRIFFVGVAIFIALVIISLYLYRPSIIPAITTTATQVTQTTQATEQPPSSVQQGTVIIAVKDKSQRVDVVGTLNELLITVTKAEVHFVGESDDVNATGEWRAVFEGSESKESKRFDLLTLTDLVGVIGQQDLPPGKYTQVRLYVEDVVFNVTNILLTIKNKRYQASVVNSSDVPSGILHFVHPFNVTAGKTTVITVDFDIAHSATRTAGGYILKPVVKITDEILERGERPANSIDV